MQTAWRKKVVYMDKGKEPHETNKQGVGLAGYCSRLAGDNMCRCGSNLKGRYCLWTHFPLPSAFEKRAEKGN